MVDVLGSEGALQPKAWHPVVRGVYEYWLSLYSEGRLPGRQHVDPCVIPHLLPHVFLVDIEGPPQRFRYRLVGTAYVDLMGRDLTGCYFDDVHPGFEGEVRRHYIDAIEQRRPVYRKGQVMFALEAQRFLGMERIIVPLARNGTDVDMILGSIVYTHNGARETVRRALSRGRPSV
jgi:hypothetical protein